MLLISHRGNIDGPIPHMENMPLYLDAALEKGFDVEMDVWVIDDKIFLGHDDGSYAIDLEWILGRKEKLWVHCKNVAAISFFSDLFKLGVRINFFWHENDTLTLTSQGYIWVYPGKQPVPSSIAVMPERENESIENCIGVCSDYILRFQHHDKE
jgi:hypothetical protein